VSDEDNVARFGGHALLQGGTFILEFIQASSFFQKSTRLRIKNSHRCLKDNNDVNLMHDQLNNLPPIYCLVWLELLKLEYDMTLLPFRLIHKKALIAIIQNQATSFMETKQWINLFVQYYTLG